MNFDNKTFLTVALVGLVLLGIIYFLSTSNIFQVPGITGALNDKWSCNVEVQRPFILGGLLGQWQPGSVTCTKTGVCGITEGNTNEGGGNGEVKVRIGDSTAIRRFDPGFFATGGSQFYLLNVCTSPNATTAEISVAISGQVFGSTTESLG